MNSALYPTQAEATIAPLPHQQGFPALVNDGNDPPRLDAGGARRRGTAQIHQGLAAWRAVGTEAARPYFLDTMCDNHPRRRVSALSLIPQEGFKMADQPFPVTMEEVTILRNWLKRKRNASVLTAILPGSGNTLLRSSHARVGSVSVSLAKNHLSQIRLKK